MRIRILPYKQLSLGAAHLAKALEGKMLFLERSRFNPTKKDVIINWGNTSDRATDLEKQVGLFLNKADKVQVAVNKGAFYELCKQAKLAGPQWTRELATAQEWAKKHCVVARTLLESSGGKGIILVNPGEQVPPAKIYTLYQPKRSEYRVHIFAGTVADVQQKRVRTGIEAPNYKVRSHDNGWVFCRENVKAPDSVIEASLAAFMASGLDFGAVDVGWVEKTNRATVYEINTAPGLEGTTLEIYSAQLTKIIKDKLSNGNRKQV